MEIKIREISSIRYIILKNNNINRIKSMKK